MLHLNLNRTIIKAKKVITIFKLTFPALSLLCLIALLLWSYWDLHTSKLLMKWKRRKTWKFLWMESGLMCLLLHAILRSLWSHLLLEKATFKFGITKRKKIISTTSHRLTFPPGSRRLAGKRRKQQRRRKSINSTHVLHSLKMEASYWLDGLMVL